MYKTANFWKRALARLIDLSLVFGLFIVVTYLSLVKSDGQWSFKYDWLFYLNCLALVALIVLFLIIIPFATNGQTIGNLATKTKLETDKKLLIALLSKEMFFGLSWVFLSLAAMALVNHTLAISYITVSTSDNNYSTWEAVRVNLVVSLSSITTLIQLVLIGSMLVKSPGWNDKLSETTIVDLKQFVEITKQENKQINNVNNDQLLKPTFIDRPRIDWE